MTQIDTSTEAVEALLKGVTQGPWRTYKRDGSAHLRFVVGPSPRATNICRVEPIPIKYAQAEDVEANASFIAAARELVPALLAERDALKAENERLKAQADTIWNEAIEVAVREISDWFNCDFGMPKSISSKLKRPVKGESHE